MLTLSLALLFISAVSLAWALLPDRARRAMRQRVLAEVPEQRRPTPWSGLAGVLSPINRWLPTGWYEAHIRALLDAAGVRLSAIHFLVLQECMAVTGAILYVVLMGTGHLNVGWLSITIVLGAMVPYLWLRNSITSRRRTIARDLPEIVDLLSLCVDAGIDFMNALERVVGEYPPCPTIDELALVMQEVRVGKRRREALRSFAARVQTPEASSFARTLIQADRMGTGIGESLRILSEDMRLQRHHWAERFAQQAPLKMLLPLLFSLAAALIIVAGPILIQFLQGGFTAQFSGPQG